MDNGLTVLSDKSLSSSLACYGQMHSPSRSMQQTKRFFNVVNVLYIDRIRDEEFAVPPFFKEHLQNVLQKEGKVIKFQCTVGGCPVPDVAWFKGHERIQEFCKENTLNELVGYKYYASNENGILTLVITNVLPEDMGPYTCKIWNQVGEARSTAMLYSQLSRNNNNKGSKSEKDSRKKVKKIVIEETITIIERRAPAMAMPSSPAVDIFENEQSVSSNSLGKPERQTDTNTIGKESQRLTLTFSIPTNCETKELTVTTSTTHNKHRTKDDSLIDSSKTIDKMREISLKKEELIDETILPTQLETEETTPHPPTPEDELLKSELCDSYSNTANLSSPESDFTDSEIRERVSWIRRGESSESDFRRNSFPYPFPVTLNENTTESNEVFRNSSRRCRQGSREFAKAKERRFLWKNSTGHTLENDYSTSECDITNSITRKSSVLSELNSASALFSTSGRTYSSSSIGSSVGTGAIARFVRAKSLNEYFEQFFDQSSRDISQETLDEDFSRMKTPPSVEDRSEYTDVFEDDIKGDVSMEYSGNEEDLLPSKSSSTNADNESETYSDLSPLVCDAKVNKDIHTSKERYPLSSNYIPPATNFAFTASENSRSNDAPKSPIIREMELLNKNIFDVEAAKELDELIVKLIEFSQENYVSVSSLKIGGRNSERTLLQDDGSPLRIIQPSSSLQHLAFSAAQLQENVPCNAFPSDKKESRLHKPEFIIPLEDVSVDAVEDVILNISVTGFPAPCITWFRDGQPLEEDEVGIINDSLERQSAIYTCVATNKVGEATTTARLTVLPSSPQTKTTIEEKLAVEISASQLSQEISQGNKKLQKPSTKRRSQVFSTSLVDYLRSRAKDFQPVSNLSSSQDTLNPLRDNETQIVTENLQPNFSPVILRRKSPNIDSLTREDITLQRGSILSLGSVSTTSYVSADEELTSSDTAVDTCEEDFLSTEEFVFPVKNNLITSSGPSDDRPNIPALPRDRTLVVSSDDEYFFPRPTTPTPGSDPPTFYEVTRNRSKALFTRQETLGDFGASSSEEMFTAESGSVTPVPARDNFPDGMEKESTPPKFLTILEEREVRLGETCILACTIVGYPTPQVAWYRNGIRIQRPIVKENSSVSFLASPLGSPYSASQRFKLFSEDKDTETTACSEHSLTITDCRITDAGEYTVTAINLYGSVVTTAQLRISPGEGHNSVLSSHSLPEFILKLSDADGMIGCETTLTCQVKGHPEPELIFYHKKEEMTNEKYDVIKEQGGRYTVVIRNLALEDEGEVKVKASNIAGFVECSAELFVDERILTPTPSKMGIPQWTDHSEELDEDMMEIHQDLFSQVIAPYFDEVTDDVVTPPGTSAIFVVRVYSWPAPNVRWYRKDELLEANSKIAFGSTDFGNHTLTIHDVTVDDADVYTCVVENGAGSVSCKAELIVNADKDSSGDEKKTDIVLRKLKDHYVIHNDLGTGAFSITRLARRKTTGEKYAAKYIRCANVDLREKYRSEISILSKLSHPNIVSFEDFFETKKNLVLLMEYAETEWFEYLLNNNVVYEKEIASQVCQVFCGLSYLHENNIVHLDLKPENVMMSEDGNTLKIIDFGSAQKIKKDDTLIWQYGNPEFVSPEVILSLPVTTSTDMWSIGVIVYVVLSGVSPFFGESDYATMIKVRKTNWAYDSRSFSTVSQISQNFISKLLVAEQSNRLSSSEALSHAWLQPERQNTINTEPLSAGRLKSFLLRRKWQRSLVTPNTSLILRPIPSLLAGEYDSTSVAVSRTAISDYLSSSTVTESDDEVDDVTNDVTTPSFLERISGLSEFNDITTSKDSCERIDSISIENIIEQEEQDEVDTTPVVKVTDSTPKSSPESKRRHISTSIVEESDENEHDTAKEDMKDVLKQASTSESLARSSDEQMKHLVSPTLLSPMNSRLRLKYIGKKVSFEDQIMQEADTEEDVSPDVVEITLPQDLDESYNDFFTSNKFTPKRMRELSPSPVLHLASVKPSSTCEGVVIDRPQSVSKMLKEDKKHIKPKRTGKEAESQSTREKIKKKLNAMASRRYRSFDLPDSSSSDEESHITADKKESQASDATSPKSKVSFFSWRRRPLRKGGSLDSSTSLTESSPQDPLPAPVIKKAAIKGILKLGGSTDSGTQSDPHIQTSLEISRSANRRREAYPSSGYQRKPLLKGVSLDLDKVEEASTNDPVSKRTRSRVKHHSASERRRLQMRRGSSAESALPLVFSRPSVGGLRGPLLEKDKVEDEDEPLAGNALRRSTPTVKGEIKHHSRSYSGSLFLSRDRMSPQSTMVSPNRRAFSLSRSFFSRSIDVAAVQHAGARIPSFGPLPEQKSQSDNLPTVSWSMPRSRSHDRFKPRRISNSGSRPLTDCYAPYLRLPLIDQGLTQEQGTATLTCVIDASPLPEVTWYKNDDLITNEKFTASEDRKTGKYQLKVCHLSLPEDFGEYSCEASNSAGIMKTSCTLKLAVIPEKPSAPELAGTDGRDVWVTWNPPPNCAAYPIAYTLQYREMAGMRWVNVDDTIEDTLYRVSNLRLTTSYRFRVRASNNAGVGLFSRVSQRMQLGPKIRTESLEYTF